VAEKEEKEGKEKKVERHFFMESLTAKSIEKRTRIEIPADLQEPPTPEPTKTTKETTKKEKQE